MIEEMRKEFEDFYINKYGVIAICSGNYTSERAIEQWDAWQASREAMRPIKLPDATFETPGGDNAFREDAVIEAIKQAGYEVE